MPYGIVLLGANGSGKSTLGRELARVLHFTHLDVETYWFHPTCPPYTSIRPPAVRNEMLLADMERYESYVVSGDISGWGDEFLTRFDLAIFLAVPTDIRLRRIDHREYARWGDRLCQGGDLYESHQKFREFAASRDVALLQQRALAYRCPLLPVDGMDGCRETAASIAEYVCTTLDIPQP